MPTVPYQPVSEVTPSGQGLSYFSDKGATEAAFGVNVGTAMEHFGQQLERTASTVESNVLASQALKNEADVNQAVTADIMTSGELNNKFRQLPGSQAQEALDDHVKALKESREKLRAGLSNDMARKMFDQQTMHRMGLDVVNSSQYAATQMKQFTKQSYSDKSDAIIQDMSENAVGANDPSRFQRGVKQLIDIEHEKGKLDGDNPEAVNKSIRTQLTKATSAITSALSKNDPAAAQKVLDMAREKKVVDASQVENIQNKIDSNAVQNYALLDAAKISSDHIQSDPTTFTRNPEGTLIKMREDAAKMADERFPNDPALRERYLVQLETNISAKVNTEKKAQADRSADLKATVSSLGDQSLPGTGRKPTSLAELNMLNPKAQDYYDEAVRRDPHFAQIMRNKFVTNNDVDNIVEPNALAKQKLIWYGMQPKDKMQTDPGDMFQKGLIDKELRDKMYTDQGKIKSQANTVFSADGIMRRHGAALNDSGIRQSATDSASNTKYMWFRGALESELQRIQTATGVQVKGPQEDQIVNDLLKEVSSGQKSFFGFGGDIKKPKYEVMGSEQPDWVKKDYRDAVKDGRTGNWLVWREGKPFFLKPPEAGK